jgi:hypothetical protein
MKTTKYQLRIGKINFYFLITLLMVALFYLWTTTSSNAPLESTKKPEDYYNLLTEAFYNWQTYILKEPDPRILSLDNPYDPIANAPYRFHDLSLYNKHYYLYFGPTPVLTLLLPYRILTGEYLSINLATTLFLLGSVIISFLIYKTLNLITGYAISKKLNNIIFLNLAFSTGAPILLRWANIYELAIITGNFYLLLGIYYLIKSILKNNNKFIILSSVSFGLAIGSRPHLILAISIIVFALVFYDIKINNIRFNKYYIFDCINFRSICIFVPFFTIIVFLLLYNYIRFGNILEFGNKYILSGNEYFTKSEYASHKISISNFFHLSNITPHSYYFLLKPFSLINNFPYFTYDIREPLNQAKLALVERDVGPIFGIIVISPIYILGILFPIIYFSKLIYKNITNYILSFVSLGSMATMILIASHNSSARYCIDFASPLLIVGIYSFILLIRNIDKFYSNLLKTLLILISIYSIMFVIAISISGYVDRGLQYQNKKQFNSLSSYFHSRPNYNKQLRFFTFNVELDFNKMDTNLILPILSSGMTGASDILYLYKYNINTYKIYFSKRCNFNLLNNYLSPFDIARSYNQQGVINPVDSQFLKVINNSSHILTFEYWQMTRQINIYIDKIKVLTIESNMFPTNKDNIFIGSDQYNINFTETKSTNYIKLISSYINFEEESKWYPRL